MSIGRVLFPALSNARLVFVSSTRMSGHALGVFWCASSNPRFSKRILTDICPGGSSPDTRFSLNSRTFQTTALRFFYASHVQTMPDDGKQVMVVNLSLDEPVWFLTISEYTKVMRGVIPEYKAKRFLRLIDMFVGASSGTSSGGSTIGSLGLVHGTFRYAQDAEAGAIVLFRKSRVEDDFPGDLDPASSFDVEASLVYHIKSVFELQLIPHSPLHTF